MDNCYLGWFWDEKTRAFKRWKEFIGEDNAKR